MSNPSESRPRARSGGSERLPRCGLYLTRGPIGSVPEGRLVYFHDHGDPGPGVYLPTRWVGNEARFESPGVLLPSPEDAAKLEPLAAQGWYRVIEAFECCERKCQTFEAELLVQLGYDGEGNAILFVPELVDGVIGVPARGTRIDRASTVKLARLRVTVGTPPRDHTVH